MKSGDSRQSYGPGILALQHHGYENEGVELDDRRCVAAMRVTRHDAQGRPLHGESTVGDVHGAYVWPAKSGGDRPTGVWSWVHLCVVPSAFAGPVTPRPTSDGPTTPTPDAPTTPTPGEIPLGDQVLRRPDGTMDAAAYLALFYAGASTLSAFWVNYFRTLAAQQAAADAQKAALQAGAGGGGGAAPGGVPFKNAQVYAGVFAPGAPGLVGGAFGIGVQALNPFGPIPGIFGLGVNPIGIIRANPFAPKGNLAQQAAQAAAKQAAKDAAAKGAAAQEANGLPWTSGPVDTGSTALIRDLLPVDATYRADQRFEKLAPVRPIGWPVAPRGAYLITTMATDEDRQVELAAQIDPRLVAANVNGPWESGSVVCDLDATGGYDAGRAARLQSAFRVVRSPTVGVGPMKGNAKRVPPSNVLAWQLGPSGQGDTFGGLVMDLPTAREGKISGSERILGALSCLYGGPIDVGHYGDAHHIGGDSDGNPINAAHLSTDALWKRRGDVIEDGPMLFESFHPGGGDLDFPVDVHLAFDPKTGFWRWWTTAMIYRPPTDTRDPQPPPEPPTTPPPNDPPTTPRPGPTFLPPARDKAVGDDAADPIALRVGAASVREIALPALAFRPQSIREGAPDLRYAAHPTMEQIEEQDLTAPITLRMEAFGAQGGPEGGPHLSEGGEWVYTQEPYRSRSLGGTSSGGIALIVPEADMTHVDAAFSPPGLGTASNVFFVATPGVRFAVGEPELSLGLVKNGVSFGVEDGDMEFRRHDGTGAWEGTAILHLLDVAEVKTISGTDFLPGVAAAGELEDLADDSRQKNIGIRTDAGNESLQVNIAGVIFTVALTT